MEIFLSRLNQPQFMNHSVNINALFLSAPYPGELKFKGQPTGLLYALTVLADRKLKNLSKKQLQKQIEVWVPAGITHFEESEFKQELEDYLIEKKPKIVGLSTFTIAYSNALKILKLIKEILPETVVIFGGAHEDNFVKYYRKRGNIDADFVIAGDGMILLDWLYQFIEENLTKTVDEIKKLITKTSFQIGKLSGAGLLMFNQGGLKSYPTQTYIPESDKRKPIRLDQLPIMPRFLLKDEEIVSSQYSIFDYKKTAQVMIGQGCPFSCGFCSEGIKKAWYDIDSPSSISLIRDLNHVEKEFKILKKGGYKSIFFDDSTFLAKPKEYVIKLVQLIDKYGFEWGCQTTQSSIHFFADTLHFFKEKGCRYVYIGLEHFDREMRDSFGKQIGSGSKYVNYSFDDTLKILEDAKIDVALSLTFGHPDPFSNDEKTKENPFTIKFAIDETKKLMDKYANIIGISINLITYHPGTKISQRYEEKVGDIHFTSLPYHYKPFIYFEEGMGPHAPGMDKQLANYILRYSRKSFGKKLWI